MADHPSPGPLPGYPLFGSPHTDPRPAAFSDHDASTAWAAGPTERPSWGAVGGSPTPHVLRSSPLQPAVSTSSGSPLVVGALPHAPPVPAPTGHRVFSPLASSSPTAAPERAEPDAPLHWTEQYAQREAMRELIGDAADTVRATALEDMETLQKLHESHKEATKRMDKSSHRLEFVMGKPLYTKRQTLLLGVALFGFIPLMSSLSLTVLLCGIIVTYMADYLDYRRGAVLSLLGTELLFGLAIVLSNIHAAVTQLGPLLMILSLACVLLSIAASALLHFRWLQESFPWLICTLERLTMSVTPIVAIPSLLATAAALAGSRYAPFWLLVVLCAEHYYFYGPLRSSFLCVSQLSTPVAKKGVDEAAPATEMPRVPQQLNSRTEARLFTLILIVLPALVYNAFQIAWAEHGVANALNTGGMVCGAIVYLSLLPSHSLWFLAPEEDSLLSQLEYDPLGLRELVGRFRVPVLSGSCLVAVHWMAYRVLHSRYAYLFSGVAYPYNVGCLLLALYLIAFIVIEVRVLVGAEASTEAGTQNGQIKRHVSVIIASILVTVLFCMLSDAPGIFYMTGVMSVIFFDVFLLDRTNTGPMITFTLCSSFHFLWWMHRTFSFVVMDLHVFGQAAVVPTPVVAVGVLWSYVLGCICFTLAFQPFKGPFLVFLFLHAQQITWVENVLFTQKEEGAYPAALVLTTSAIGVVLAHRLYRNEVLGVSGASFVASCYVAKLYTFAVVITSAYYYSETESTPFSTKLLAAEITVGWWVALLAGYVIARFEMERRRIIEIQQSRRLVYVYLAAVVLLVAFSCRNVQRAAHEFVSRRYVRSQNLLHIAPGTTLLTGALLTVPFFRRHEGRYPFMRRLASVFSSMGGLGILLLALQPTSSLDVSTYSVTHNFHYSNVGSVASIVGVCLLTGVPLLPLQRMHDILRTLYWLLLGLSLAISMTCELTAKPSFYLFIFMGGFVFLILLTMDMGHYRNMSSVEGMVTHVLSVLMLITSFAALRSEDLSEEAHGDPYIMQDILQHGLQLLLTFASFAYLSIAILFKCRLSGYPLLPGCTAMTKCTTSQVMLVCNCSTLLAVISFAFLNFIAIDNEPGLYVLISLFLLLLVDDRVIFTQLHARSFRYFPPAVVSMMFLWGCVLYNAWGMGVLWRDTLGDLVRCGMLALWILPSHLSLLAHLWGSSRRSATKNAVIVLTIVMGLVPFLLTSRKTIQWMAIVGISGQTARFFGAQVRHSTGQGHTHR